MDDSTTFPVAKQNKELASKMMQIILYAKNVTLLFHILVETDYKDCSYPIRSATLFHFCFYFLLFF